jgi:hypothetical protein
LNKGDLRIPISWGHLLAGWKQYAEKGVKLVPRASLADSLCPGLE